MGKGLEGCLHTAAFPFITVASVRLEVGVRTDDYLCGNFGWVGTPYAFNVVFRTLDVITEHTIDGAGLWYVDDLNGCSNRRTRISGGGQG